MIQRLGASLVAFKLKAVGALQRALSDRLSDGVSVLDFGADRTGVTPSADAFQACLDYCSGRIAGTYGMKMRIPGGEYEIEKPLEYTWWYGSDLVDNTVRRLTIEGDGSANTILNYTGTAGTTAFSIKGSQDDPHLRLVMRDFMIQRKDQARNGVGIAMKNISIGQMIGVDVRWFNTGLVGNDVIQLMFMHCQFGANVIGANFAKVDWTCPNIILFNHVMFAGNYQMGVQIVDGSNVMFDSCSYEGNGNDNTAGGTHRTINYIGAPAEGGIGLIVQNGYFENNMVSADIAIENATGVEGNHSINRNTFQRTSPTRFQRTFCNFSSLNARMSIDYEFNNHKHAGGYVPNGVDKPWTVQTQFVEMFERGNSYEANQYPDYSNIVVRGHMDSVVAACRTDGTTLFSSHNISSVERTSTGVYKLTFRRPLFDDLYIPTATPLLSPGRIVVTQIDKNYLEVTVQDNGGNVSNSIPFNLIVVGNYGTS